jgi:hypothetical protein
MLLTMTLPGTARRLAATRLPTLTVVLVLALAACSATSASTPPAGAIATATPPPCNTHATTTAVVWDEGQQIHGGIGGAAPSQLSSFRYPLGLPDEGFDGNRTVPGFLAVSPDDAHIAVDENVFVPFIQDIYPYVVDTATHVVTRVILPAYPPNARRRAPATGLGGQSHARGVPR